VQACYFGTEVWIFGEALFLQHEGNYCSGWYFDEILSVSFALETSSAMLKTFVPIYQSYRLLSIYMLSHAHIGSHLLIIDKMLTERKCCRRRHYLGSLEL